MKDLTLRQEVAQMVMPRLDGMKLGDSRYLSKVQELIQSGIGGFILFGGSSEETPHYLREIQTLAEVPLLIASDIERGLGQQLTGGTRFPNQRAVASAINRRSGKDLKLLDSMLAAVRIETRAAGIHAIFSPVVDVNNNPANPIICTRAFGDEPDVVSWFGSRYIKQLQKPGRSRDRVDILACAKHFPGHGDTDQDSHNVLPVIRANKPRLNRIELPPFRQAVRDGVGMVMVAHLLVPALEPEKPTTFSKKTVTALLREGMEFNGLIVSDALDMGALAGAYSQEEIAVRSVEAGMDILLHPQDAVITINAVVAAVEQGRLTRQHITESVERIMAAKTRLGLFDKPGQKSVRGDSRKHLQVAQEMGRKALRIRSGGKKIFPLKRDSGTACFILDDDNSPDTGDMFIRTMREYFKYLSIMVLTPGSDMPESLMQDSITAADSVVIAIYSRISASKGYSGLADKLRDRALQILRVAKTAKTKSIVISFDSPYLLDTFEDADARVAAYDRIDEIQQAAVALLVRK
jgi:beta-glucosidase-like glycosyl hydrolase